MDEVMRQRDWTDAELRAAGYRYYQRRKQLVLAGRLPPSAAPLEIHYPLETVIAEAGDVICFEVGDVVHQRVLDYEHWSVKPDIFLETYRKWDVPGWQPGPPVKYLMKHGCRPYYKSQGAWAIRLSEATWIQSLESSEPLLVPEGMWLLIGTSGEPWHNSDEQFRSRYVVEDD